MQLIPRLVIYAAGSILFTFTANRPALACPEPPCHPPPAPIELKIISFAYYLSFGDAYILNRYNKFQFLTGVTFA
jgi:hypothetical protein